MAESKYLALNLKRDTRREVFLNFEEFAGHKKILVVDDAIDSGETMKAVTDQLKESGEINEIRTAVLTVTTPLPAFDPDYTIYKDRTLIRFPWSKDYRVKNQA